MIRETFRKLIELINSYSEEEADTRREGLTDEQKAIFDILRHGKKLAEKGVELEEILNHIIEGEDVQTIASVKPLNIDVQGHTITLTIGDAIFFSEKSRSACPNGGTLTATTEGWVCPCGKYKQDWAHKIMSTPEDGPIQTIKRKPIKPKNDNLRRKRKQQRK